MAKGQQRSNKEKKKPKQDKKKLAPAPSPLASDQRHEARLGRQEEIASLFERATVLMRYYLSA